MLCEPSVKLKINETHNLPSQQTPLGDKCNHFTLTYIHMYVIYVHIVASDLATFQPC